MADITFNITADPTNFYIEVLETGFKYPIARNRLKSLVNEADLEATIRYALFNAKKDGILDPDNVNLVNLRNYLEARAWPLL